MVSPLRGADILWCRPLLHTYAILSIKGVMTSCGVAPSHALCRNMYECTYVYVRRWSHNCARERARAVWFALEAASGLPRESAGGGVPQETAGDGGVPLSKSKRRRLAKQAREQRVQDTKSIRLKLSLHLV